MEKYCDLHTHSIFSDGTMSPEELVDIAIERGISALALTDHNTADGLARFVKYADKRGLEVAPGVEFSVDYNGRELHLLGLFIGSEDYSAVSELMNEANRRKEESNIALIDALDRAGIKLDYQRIKDSTQSGRINRAHIATAMVEAGYVKDRAEAFEKYLSPSKGFYKEPQRLTALEIIDFIKSIGAVSVLAHPFLNLDYEGLRAFLPMAKARGLVGMECYYSTYDDKTRELSLALAEEFSLIPSGGSDYHGANKPDIDLGSGKGNLRVPYECFCRLKNSM